MAFKVGCCDRFSRFSLWLVVEHAVIHGTRVCANMTTAARCGTLGREGARLACMPPPELPQCLSFMLVPLRAALRW